MKQDNNNNKNNKNNKKNKKNNNNNNNYNNNTNKKQFKHEHVRTSYPCTHELSLSVPLLPETLASSLGELAGS